MGTRPTSVPTRDVATQPEVTVYGASVGIGREWSRSRVGVSVPYYLVRIDDGVSRDSESGLGDVVVWGEWDVIPGQPDRLSLTASTLVKLPTADEDKGLGTGETDYGAFVEIGRRHRDLRPFASLGYIWKGDAPQTDYRNTRLYSLGVVKYLGRDELYGSLDARDAILAGTGDTRLLSIGWLHELSRARTLRLDASTGIDDDSPDLVVTIEWMHWF